MSAPNEFASNESIPSKTDAGLEPIASQSGGGVASAFELTAEAELASPGEEAPVMAVGADALGRSQATGNAENPEGTAAPETAPMNGADQARGADDTLAPSDGASDAASEATSEATSDGASGRTDEAATGEEENFDKVSPDDTARQLAQQVRIKREDDHVSIIFPKEETNANPDVAVGFIDSQIWLDLQQRLSGGKPFDSQTPVHLYTQNSLWDTRQLQELDEALGRFNLTLVRIITSRRQTAVAAAMSGYSADQVNHLPELLSQTRDRAGSPALAEPLYLQTTVRSGTEIRHPGSVIIVGDLNPGSSIIADGDILVWGRLRGIAHAGASGNQQSTIMALKLEAPQLRIAKAVARVAAQTKSVATPEIAYVTPQGIRITPADSFSRSDLLPSETDS